MKIKYFTIGIINGNLFKFVIYFLIMGNLILSFIIYQSAFFLETKIFIITLSLLLLGMCFYILKIIDINAESLFGKINLSYITKQAIKSLLFLQ